MRKILSLLLVVMMCFTMFGSAVAEETLSTQDLLKQLREANAKAAAEKSAEAPAEEVAEEPAEEPAEGEEAPAGQPSMEMPMPSGDMPDRTLNSSADEATVLFVLTKDTTAFTNISAAE